MFAISVTEKGGDQKRLEFDKPEVTIGRVQGNDIILPKGNVSKRHSRIVLKDGKFIIVDLKSTNGTYVNGRKITSPLVVKGTDKIYIGDFIMVIEDSAASDAAPPPPPKKGLATAAPPPPPKRSDGIEAADGDDEGPPQPNTSSEEEDDAHDEPEEMTPPPEPRVTAPRAAAQPQPAPRTPTAPREVVAAAPAPRAAPRPTSPTPSPAASVSNLAAVRSPSTTAPRAAAAPAAAVPRIVTPRKSSEPVVDAGKRAAAAQLYAKLELAKRGPEVYADSALRLQADSVARELAQANGAGANVDEWVADLVSEAVGVGPLEDILGDEDVTEMLVASYDRVFVARDGSLEASARIFTSPEALDRAIARLAWRNGADAEEARRRDGWLATRLADGLLMTAVLAPLAARGPSVNIRRSRSIEGALSNLVDEGIVSQAMADFLQSAVHAKRNILVCGAESSGRSTVLAGLLSCVGESERVALIEELPEIEIGDRPWVALRGGSQSARESLARARGLKVSRLVIDELRGVEALDVVTRLAGGAEGSLATITAGSPREALMRLEALALLAKDAPAADALRAEIGRGLSVVVHVARSGDEVRVVDISDVSADDDGPRARPVFQYKPDGKGGRFAPTGYTPAWAEGMESG